MTNSEMIKTLREILSLQYSSCYKMLQKDGTYQYPFAKQSEALAHALELLEKEEKGEIVRLPCPVGTKIFTLGWLKATAYFKAHINDEGNIIPDDVDLSNDEYGVIESELDVSDYDEIGKTVFLTREEAKKALSEMEEKNCDK